MSVPNHQWSLTKQHMPIEDVDSNLQETPGYFIIDPSEAERLVENLKLFPIEEIGSSAWLTQHQNLERLNMQAHQSASSNSDEYVLEAIMTFGKIDLLIHDLITIEAWKENIYPLILNEVAGKNTMRMYFILYHEATIVNLFEILFYHKHVCESCGEKMIEMVDYCARKLTRLNGGYDFRSLEPAINLNTSEAALNYAQTIENRTPEEELAQYLTEIEFRVCISSCALARFICEHSDALPLSIASRITDTHDFLGAKLINLKL